MRMNHSYRTAMYGKIATPVVAFVVSTLFSWQAMAETLEAFTEPYQQIAVPAAEIGVIESLLIKETLDRHQIEEIMRGNDVVSDDERKAFYEAQKKSKDLKKVVLTTATAVKEDDSAAMTPPFSALPQGT